MLPEFSTQRPETKEVALTLLRDLKDVKVLAGGTDLLVRMGRGSVHAHLMDIGALADLDCIEHGNGTLLVGAAATHRKVHEDHLVRTEAKSLSLASGLVGSPQIRNMGTIGGNLVNASPAADSIAPLLVHDAKVVLESEAGSRRVALEEFIVAPYKTSIRDDELLTRIEIKSCEGYREGYRRVAKRAAWAISRLSVAWAIKEEAGRFVEVRLAIGSCTPIPFRPKDAEAYLAGKEKGGQASRVAIDMIVSGIRLASGERPSFVYKIPVLEALLDEILRG
ncbi:MAG TPA: FAD binding domain-containing protein [Syntrophorhabdaceae bacterium]|jgi:CO/xanthine dehydrogenase FAD-binding subunit